jgi:hypothetical protein
MANPSLFINRFSITRDDFMTRVDFMEERIEDQNGQPRENVVPVITVIMLNGDSENLMKALVDIKEKQTAMRRTKQ